MRRLRHSQGSTLLIVFWAMFILSAAIFAWVKLIQQDISLAAAASAQLEARAMAHSGVAIALNPQVTRKTPLLEEQFSSYLGYKVTMVGEGGRLNLNWLIDGADRQKLKMLNDWLTQMDLSFREREIFIDSLSDYIDGDDVRRLNGQEAQGDYQPANRVLESVDELTEVANSKLLTSKRGWREQLTIHTQKIDVAAAEKNILKLLPGMSDGRIQRLLDWRRGKDRIDGTIDDPVIKGIGDLYPILGLNAVEKQAFDLLAEANNPMVRIISVGKCAEVVRQVEVVALKGATPPDIKSWKE